MFVGCGAAPQRPPRHDATLVAGTSGDYLPFGAV
jgi:hypothetical protein